MAARNGGGILSSVRTGIHESLDRPWTQRDLDDTPDDGNRYEVIDGKLHVTPFPTCDHQVAVTELLLLLGEHVRSSRAGWVVTSGLKVVLDELTGVGPDIVYIAREQAAGIRHDGFHGPPTLVVEVLSSKPSLDTRIKRDRYASAGIPHYWIVDPVQRTLREYRLEGSDYALRAEAAGDAEFRPELFPGLVIPLARLWFAA
jgi:Uma2 family endonuclease